MSRFDLVNIWISALGAGGTAQFYGVRWDGEPGKSSGRGRMYKLQIEDDGVEPRLVIERIAEYPFEKPKPGLWKRLFGRNNE